MRSFIIAGILTFLSLSSFAKSSEKNESSCRNEGIVKARERVKTLASEVMTIKGELELVGDSPYFTVGGSISAEERASEIANHRLVPGDMLWPLDAIISKEVAQATGLGNGSFAAFGGFLLIRCKSATSPEVEKIWFQYDVEAADVAAE